MILSSWHRLPMLDIVLDCGIDRVCPCWSNRRRKPALILAALVDSPAERAAAVAQFETGLKFMKNHLIEGHWRIEWAQRQGVAAGFSSDY